MLLELARADVGVVRLAEFHVVEDLVQGRLVELFPDHQKPGRAPSVRRLPWAAALQPAPSRVHRLPGRVIRRRSPALAPAQNDAKGLIPTA